MGYKFETAGAVRRRVDLGFVESLKVAGAAATALILGREVLERPAHAVELAGEAFFVPNLSPNSSI